jgi:hypothetical protein
MTRLRTRLDRIEAALPADQRDALEVLRSVGLGDLARELGPAGAVEWLARNDAAFEATGCTVEELERLADGEEPTEVLGAERAARLAELTDG